jgi:hypothetical protein
MAVTAKQLAAADFAANTATTIYTVPANTRTIIDKFTACNTDASARTLSIHIVASGGSVGDSNLILDALSIAANTTVEIEFMKNHVLETGQTIRAFASQASTISIRCSGREVA